MRISRRLLTLVITLCCSPCLFGGQYHYVRGGTSYEVRIDRSRCEVVCAGLSGSANSRDYSLLTARTRVQAIDLVGAAILFDGFARQNGVDAGFFQIYADYLSFEYKADVSSFVQEKTTQGGKPAIKYSCRRSDYDIKEASYRKDFDMNALVKANYERLRSEDAARLWCEYGELTLSDYFGLGRDFFSGNAQIVPSFSALQGTADRLELSVFTEDTHALTKSASECVSKSDPFRQFCLAELTTTAPLALKSSYYLKWTDSLASNSLAESILKFCSSKCSEKLPKTDLTISDLIASFPGCISPFSIRRMSDPEYNAAAALYAKSDFIGAIGVLIQSLDINGLDPRSLNLIGGAYRLSDNPRKAMPFLLLAFWMQPDTEYLVGNIALCLEKLAFPRSNQFAREMLQTKVDPWSRKQLESILK